MDPPRTGELVHVDYNEKMQNGDSLRNRESVKIAGFDGSTDYL